MTAKEVLIELKKKDGRMYTLTQEGLTVAIMTDSDIPVLVDEWGQIICPIDLANVPDYYNWKEFNEPIFWKI